MTTSFEAVVCTAAFFLLISILVYSLHQYSLMKIADIQSKTAKNEVKALARYLRLLLETGAITIEELKQMNEKQVLDLLSSSGVRNMNFTISLSFPVNMTYDADQNTLLGPTGTSIYLILLSSTGGPVTIISRQLPAVVEDVPFIAMCKGGVYINRAYPASSIDELFKAGATGVDFYIYCYTYYDEIVIRRGKLVNNKVLLSKVLLKKAPLVEAPLKASLDVDSFKEELFSLEIFEQPIIVVWPDGGQLKYYVNPPVFPPINIFRLPEGIPETKVFEETILINYMNSTIVLLKVRGWRT
ncbi:MAG: hypothetical protein DRJ52_04395 [Thermoprotei archaeon]|nr:MAG: hypothetical protein DRJ52_04395 [Thermoprotei archaeon]